MRRNRERYVFGGALVLAPGNEFDPCLLSGCRVGA
jgi:hypothetical protein